MSALNPASGAPGLTPPNPANYSTPQIGQLTSEINQLEQQPATTVDTTAFNQTYSQQQSYLTYLQNVANGTQQTQAQIQGQQTQQIADSQLQGQAQQVQGAQGVQSARQENLQQASQDSNIMAQTAQVAATQRQQAQSDAVNLESQMSQEQLSLQGLQLNAQEQNAQRTQSLISDTLTLSGMQQAANIAYQTQLSQYQETVKQQAVAAKAAQNSAITHFVIGGVLAVGAAVSAVLTPVTGGLGAVGAVGLGVAAAQQFAQGAGDEQTAKAEE